MKKLLFVYNPHAGKGLIKNHLCDIINIFTRGGYEVTAYPTQAPRDGMNKIIRDCSRFDILVVSGGDGTLSEAIKAMMQLEHKIPIGYIPAGSTNDFASSMDIPKKMCEAARAIVKGVAFDYDIGEFNGEFYVYVAAFGAFADVSYETSQVAKNRFGHMAYLAEALRRLPTYTGYNITVEHDGGTVKGSFILGMVTNSTSVGGLKRLIADNVAFDDGLFEVTLVKTPSGPIAFQSLLRDAAINKMSEKNFVTFRTSFLKVHSAADIAWSLDGESGGSHNHVEIYNHKQAVSIIILPDDKTAEQQLVHALDSERSIELPENTQGA